MKRTTVLIILLMLATSACTSVGRLEKDASFNSQNESVIVLGVSPANYRVSIFPGTREAGVFHQSILRPAVVYGAAEDGYIVTKATANDTLAITNIRLIANKDSIYGTDFAPCEGKMTMVFDVPAGKVLYLGSIEYEFAGRNLRVKYGQDIDVARKYVDANYPKLSGRLEPWPFEILPTTLKCTTTITVPVYLPRR